DPRPPISAHFPYPTLFRSSQPPIDDIDTYWEPHEKAQAMRMLARSIVGSPDTVRAGIAALVEETGADELIIVSDVYDHAERLRSDRKSTRLNSSHVKISYA